MGSFLSGVDASGWLKHIQAILKTAHFVARAIAIENISVLVHCSDGWDRTAQTCALAQVMLDPYYRTIQGLQALIEKDWLSFGHKFNDRCGHLLGSGDSKEVSPVFTQFLDCLYQMQTQYPQAFEFNESFLLLLHDHVYSCQYGTFLGNNDKQRRDAELASRTYSLWGYIHSHRNSDSLNNPIYTKNGPDLLFPNTSSQAMTLWVGMYNRFDSGLHPSERIGTIVGSVKDHVASLQDHAQQLRIRIAQLKPAIEQRQTLKKKKSKKNFDSKPLDLSAIRLEDVKASENVDVQMNVDWNGGQSSTPQLEKRSKPELVVCPLGGPLCSPTSECETLKPLSPSPDADTLDFTASDLLNEMDSVAVDWRHFRQVSTCPACGISGLEPSSDPASSSRHCWSCGDIFCQRCTGSATVLPGHASRRPAPVCKPCQRDFMPDV